ncbi:unnamed protein product [Larinioides sclopetarius]|uniref:Choline/ethanolamine kinase n=1 Tax=Larinioides sclopetarius TaxID=280406 RepID=A0AAV2A5F3_9ARAC
MATALTEDLESMKEEAYKICQDFLGDIWTELPISEFRFSIVKGGLNNAKYRCCLPENAIVKNQKTPRQVLLRIYGPLQEDLDDIIREVATFLLLAERKLGPKLYGVFPNGRLEEFIPSRTLSSKDYKVMYPAIAREMAKFHSLDVPVRKIPDLWTVFMKKWLDEVKVDGTLKKNSTIDFLVLYTEETQWLTEIMKKSNSPVVYCHNDLLGGNILFREDSPSEEDPRLTFIDIEFGAYNYRYYSSELILISWSKKESSLQHQ